MKAININTYAWNFINNKKTYDFSCLLKIHLDIFVISF